MDDLLLLLLFAGWMPPFLRRWLGPLVPQRMGEDAALETLRRRYAAGEIGLDEFEERRRVLVGSSTEVRDGDR